MALQALVVGGIKRKTDGKIDYSEDFFGKKAFMTVSGQLQVETYACGLGNVYTFGPTFRAENSHTTRHLAEFWVSGGPIQPPNGGFSFQRGEGGAAERRHLTGRDRMSSPTMQKLQ
jgi:hypothetical protein